MWKHWFHRYTAWGEVLETEHWDYQEKTCTICFKVKRRDV